MKVPPEALSVMAHWSHCEHRFRRDLQIDRPKPAFRGIRSLRIPGALKCGPASAISESDDMISLYFYSFSLSRAKNIDL
jgi:hypothetical protein